MHSSTARNPTRAILAALLFALMANAVSAEWPEVGENDFRVSFDSLLNPAFRSTTAAVAFNPDRGEYLVGWIRGIQPPFKPSDVLVQRLDAQGAPIDSPQILGSAFTLSNLRISYGAADGRFLVLWANEDVPVIQGRLLTETALVVSPILGLSSVCSEFGPVSSECDADVAYNPRDGEFLVVYNHYDNASGTRAIRGRRHDANTGNAIGSFVSIDEPAAGTLRQPAVAYNPVWEHYMVVWQINAPDDIDIGGRRVAANGSTIGNTVRVSDMGPNNDTSYGAHNPDIVYNPTDDFYLIVWSGNDDRLPLAPDEREIFGQFFDPLGRPFGEDDFLLSDAGDLGSDQFEAREPRVEFSTATETFLVTWHGDDNVGGLVESESEIFGQFVGRDGREVGPNDFRISDLGGTGDPTYSARRSVIAAHPAASEFLVLWYGDDDLGGLQDNEFEIFGQRIERPTLVFTDGFESGNTAAWSLSVP